MDFTAINFIPCDFLAATSPSWCFQPAPSKTINPTQPSSSGTFSKPRLGCTRLRYDHVTTALLICGFSLKARNDGQSNDLMQQPLLARIDGRQVLYYESYNKLQSDFGRDQCLCARAAELDEPSHPSCSVAAFAANLMVDMYLRALGPMKYIMIWYCYVVTAAYPSFVMALVAYANHANPPAGIPGDDFKMQLKFEVLYGTATYDKRDTGSFGWDCDYKSRQGRNSSNVRGTVGVALQSVTRVPGTPDTTRHSCAACRS
ncbi:hypothetical protein F5887DRAFT_922673 [Amanita rubescens]|nr:hypothetical protein F5887DRAFT_922673 [Amanita rubescens]